MVTDIVPELLEKIQHEFERNVKKDAVIGVISGRIRDGTATLEDVHDYAEKLGEALSAALTSQMKESILPGGRLYWNIADRTIRPMLENNYYLVNDAAGKVQRVIDEAAQIGMAPVAGEMPAGRVHSLVEKAVSAESYEDVRVWLSEPIVNCSESFFDDWVMANAKARCQAGLSAKIIRKAESGCCQWCTALAGTYDYEDLSPGDDVYRRHAYCRCVVTFKSGRLQQDTHSKRWYDDSGTSILRSSVKADIRRSSPAQARMLEQALLEETERKRRKQRADLIAAYQQEHGVSHRRAANRLSRAGDLTR